MTYMFIYDQYFVIKKNASAQIIQYCFVYKKHSCLINDIKHTHSSKVFKLCVCRKGKRGGVDGIVSLCWFIGSWTFLCLHQGVIWWLQSGISISMLNVEIWSELRYGYNRWFVKHEHTSYLKKKEKGLKITVFYFALIHIG